MKLAEQWFEDWICEHLEEVTGDPEARLIGRQVVLQDGTRLDVLVDRPDPEDEGAAQIVVIEVKAGTAKPGAVQQLLGYVGNLRRAVSRIGADGLSHANERVASVAGILAAPSITDAASLLLDAVPNVTFTQLQVEISAAPGGCCDPWDRSTPDDDTVANLLCDAVASNGKDVPRLPVEEMLEGPYDQTFDPDMWEGVPAVDDERDLPIAAE